MIPLPQPRFKPFLQTLGRRNESTRTIASARGLAAKTSTLESPADNRMRTVVSQASLKAAFCPAPAPSGPVCPGIAMLLPEGKPLPNTGHVRTAVFDRQFFSPSNGKDFPGIPSVQIREIRVSFRVFSGQSVHLTAFGLRISAGGPAQGPDRAGAN